MRRIILAFLAVTLGAGPAGAEGINLSWDDCGTAGVEAKAFACDTNEGADVLVGSFVTGPGLDSLAAIQAKIDIRTTVSPLPDWWRHNSTPGANPLETPQCRDTTGLAIEFDFSTGWSSCTNVFEPAKGDVAGYRYDVVEPNRARLLLQLGNPHARVKIIPGQEYYAFRVVLSHKKSVGPGSCAGCQEEACIVLNEMTLYEGSAFNPQVRLITTPADRQYVTWQGSPVPQCPEATSVRRSTWGAIKSLYR